MRLHSGRRSSFGAVVAIPLLFTVMSCGTSSAPSQADPTKTTATPTSATETTASPSATECADVAALKSSLSALTHLNPTQDGVAALAAAIANVKANLDKAEASASPVLQPSVQQVKTAFGELQTATSDLNTGNLTEKAPAIAVALRQVATATKALSSTLAETCPGS